MSAETIGDLIHPGPWIEDDYFALGETPTRIELLDGSLIVSPARSARHQQLARRLAKLAGIPWYLLAQIEPIELRLFRLDGGHYVEHATAGKDETLRLTEPVRVDLDTTRLLARRPG